jgi:MFS family permease
MFSGRAFDAGYFRPTIILGIAIQIVGIFTMSVAKNYWQLLMTQGICTGIGGGIFFVPIMSLCSTYFAKRRGMAIGIVTSGNSVGGIIYPIVVRELLGKVGFGWTVRVLGFINIISLAIVIAFMKPRLPPRKTGPLIDMDAFRDPPYLIHILGMCFIMPPVYFVFYYVCLSRAFILLFLLTLTQVASFAREELGMAYTTSLNLVIILNGVGVPARVLPGYIADHYLGVLNTFWLCIMCTMVIFWAWLGVNSIPGYYAFITLYGLFSAAFQSLFPTTIAALSNDITKTGTRLGMSFTAIGFSALVGGPIAGAIVKAEGGYVGVICWASVSTLVGALLIGWARACKHGWGWTKRC